jgi:transposase
MIASQVGITHYLARQKPLDKAQFVETLQAEGHRVAFVGDGINDSPALVKSHLGIAMGTGSDIAIEAGHLTLTRPNLISLADTLTTSKQVTRIIKQNLLWALIYNTLALPAAAMGYTGSERTTRRVVATLKDTYRRRQHRIYKPWITEPGMWLQYDFGDGPSIGGVKAVLFCAWLAWSQFRVIIPLGDRTMPSVIAALDQTFRLVGGVPTYVLTDNEKTVTNYHLCGIAVRNEAAVAISRYYGTSIVTCVPYDPESKGGSESSVKVAKADLVPTEYNLLGDYDSFSGLETACRDLMAGLNGRRHSVTRQVPAEMLEVERAHLHPVPDVAYTGAFGESRVVGWSSTVSFRGTRYSVPHTLAGGQVWVRVAAQEVVIVAGVGSGATEVARHPHMGPGQASIRDEHYPERRRDPLDRAPRATKPSEAAFLGHVVLRVEAIALGGAELALLGAELLGHVEPAVGVRFEFDTLAAGVPVGEVGDRDGLEDRALDGASRV